MTVNVLNTVRQSRVNQISTAIGASGILRIWAGSKPANPSTADPAAGNKLAEFTLGTTAFASATGAEGATVTAALNGTPLTATAGNTGTASFFRFYTSGGVCQFQGDVGTDMTVTPTSIQSGATVTVSSFSVTEAA
jgi:hypothetical protein